MRADTVLYSTGFEAPTFTTAPIAGQNGWAVYGTGISTVENTFAYAGSQAVFINNNTSQSGPYYGLSVSGPVMIQQSAEIVIFSSTTESGWQFAATGPGLNQYIGGIDVDPTTNAIHAITAGFPIIGTFKVATAFNSSAWNSVSFLFNLATQTYSITIDGVTLDSNVPFCGNNIPPCNGAVVSTYGDGFFDTLGNPSANDSAYMDNYSVTEIGGVPEPASLGLIAVAALLAFAVGRIRAC